MDLGTSIQDSIVSIKSKVLPNAVPQAAQQPFSQEGVLESHILYDFFNLDFKSRTGRETIETDKKLETIKEYLKENYGDIPTGLADLTRKFGETPVDISRLDNFYHKIRYDRQAFDMQANDKKEAKYRERLDELAKEESEVRTALAEARNSVKNVKDLEKQTMRLARLEKMRSTLQETVKKTFETVKEVAEPLVNGPTPSPTV